MGRLLRRAATGVSAIVLGVLLSPAGSASAATQYTPEEACANDFGGTWSRTSDGHRELISYYGHEKWGDVYLMYRSATGENCVATIKTRSVGSYSSMDARIYLQGESDWRRDSGYYRYYAAVRAKAAGTCVKYDGSIDTADDFAVDGRYTWGNCG